MSKENSKGVILHDNSSRQADYLYRISLKCLIRNEKGEVLVVKETGRDHWDLPGGGMDHGEDIKSAIARELYEEVGYAGKFDYRILHCEDPKFLKEHNFWQIRLIYEIIPSEMLFRAGADADKIAFIHPDTFQDSIIESEKKIRRYSLIDQY